MELAATMALASSTGDVLGGLVVTTDGANILGGSLDGTWVVTTVNETGLLAVVLPRLGAGRFLCLAWTDSLLTLPSSFSFAGAGAELRLEDVDRLVSCDLIERGLSEPTSGTGGGEGVGVADDASLG